MSKINMLGFNGLGLILNSILDPFIQLFYQLYFVFTKAIAWTLDMITQLFFIFGGMTPVSSTTKINESTGEYVKNDILNMFIQDKAFTKAYFWLCIIALGLVIVFTIGKIINKRTYTFRRRSYYKWCQKCSSCNYTRYPSCSGRMPN